MEKGQDLITKILKIIDDNDSVNSHAFATDNNHDHEKVKGALNSLALKDYVVLKKEQNTRWSLTKEGQRAADNGTTEYQIFQELAEGVKAKADLQV